MTVADLTKAEAKDEIHNLSRGMPSKYAGAYVWPNDQTRRAYEAFIERFRQRKFGFMPVRGNVGAGKTRLATKLRADLRMENMAVSHVVLRDPEEIRRAGISTFLPQNVVTSFALMQDGVETPLIDELEKPAFKKKLHKVFEDPNVYNRLYYNGSRHLTVAFEALSSGDGDLEKAARDWLEGAEPSSDNESAKARLKLLRARGLETKAKSIRFVTMNETLFFLREIAAQLGHSPMLIIVDEIEQAGELPPKMGSTFLSGIRDLINLLYQTEHDAPVQNGLFVAISISDQYLSYAGIAEEVPDLEVPGREQIYQPRTDLRSVPRLWTVLTGVRSWADVNITERAKMVEIGERVRDLYIKAYGDGDVSEVDVKALVDDWYPKWKHLTPRAYIPKFIEEFEKALTA